MIADVLFVVGSGGPVKADKEYLVKGEYLLEVKKITKAMRDIVLEHDRSNILLPLPFLDAIHRGSAALVPFPQER